MRGLLTILILTASIGLFSQDVEVLTSGDSLTIRSTNITNNPLNFGNHSLDNLLKLNPKTSVETVLNPHVENKIDTIFTFSLGTDKFKVYKVNKEKNILTNADLLTNRFKTRQGIKVGMTKQEVVKLLSEYRLTTIPNYLVLENQEVPEYLTFKFSKDKVAKIIYDGYID